MLCCLAMSCIFFLCSIVSTSLVFILSCLVRLVMAVLSLSVLCLRLCLCCVVLGCIVLSYLVLSCLVFCVVLSSSWCCVVSWCEVCVVFVLMFSCLVFPWVFFFLSTVFILSLSKWDRGQDGTGRLSSWLCFLLNVLLYFIWFGLEVRVGVRVRVRVSRVARETPVYVTCLVLVLTCYRSFVVPYLFLTLSLSSCLSSMSLSDGIPKF
jgi:hypothetical protein